jgi:hypothetical protein
VQERRDEFELHPLAERQVPDRAVDERADAEQVDEVVPRPSEAVRIDPVDPVALRIKIKTKN